MRCVHANRAELCIAASSRVNARSLGDAEKESLKIRCGSTKGQSGTDIPEPDAVTAEIVLLLTEREENSSLPNFRACLSQRAGTATLLQWHHEVTVPT